MAEPMDRDRRWMGRVAADVVAVLGKDALDLLHRLSTQDLRPLARSGDSALTVIANTKGRALDWLRVVRRDEEVLLVCGPGRAPAVSEWIDRHTIMEDVRTAPPSTPWCLVRAGTDGGDWAAPAEARWPEVAGGGVELLVPASRVEPLWAAARASGVREVDERWLEVRRVLLGIPSQAHELANQPSPLELRLARSSVSFAKGCYIGQEVISRIDSYDKLARCLMGFEGRGAALSRVDRAAAGVELMREGRAIGRVTSLEAIDAEGRLAGLAIVEIEQARPGAAWLSCAGEGCAVELVDRPFWTTD